MNEFPKRSKASISKRTNLHILKAFNKIKEITHGSWRKYKRKYEKYKIVEAGADVFFGKF
jgi:hypothetical protein